jgi:GAF domain-containing protein
MSEIHQFQLPEGGSRAEAYPELFSQLTGLLDGETDAIAGLANCASLLYFGCRLWWVGFYRVASPDQLVLGPFQGKVACVRIAPGKGVCGTAADSRSTVIVPDVHAFPGHIACDSASNSEIVVPLPRPRTPEMTASPQFAAVVHTLRSLIREESLAAMGGELSDGGLAGLNMEVGPQGVAQLV